jgi:DNA polymerase IV
LVNRKIIHVDMDCFYAAVEVKHRPELKGKPLGIGGPANSRGVLCTASYEARKFGVRSAMPSSQAARLCPDIILIPPRFELYKKESGSVRQIFERFTPVIQPLSLDEAYLDVTEASEVYGSATKVAQEIRYCIETELNLTASAGVAPNKFLAKIASDWKKPNGLFVIRPHQVEAFVRDLKVEKIWGVGKVTADKMHKLGLHTCADIQKTPVWQLAKWFGSRGPELFELAHGRDERPVRAHQESKSLTVEETYGKDLESFAEVASKVEELYEDWSSRMDRKNYSDRIRGHVAKLRFHDFTRTTAEASSKAWPTVEDFKALLQKAWDRRDEPVRLVGLGVRLEDHNEDDETDQLRLPL